MFRNVRNIVIQKSNNEQIPWESTSLTGDFYFNHSGLILDNKPVAGDGKEIITYGSIELITEISGELYLDGNKIANIKSITNLTFDKLIIISSEFSLIIILPF